MIGADAAYVASGFSYFTVETLLLHTDLTARKACSPAPEVADALERFAKAHAGLEAERSGRLVGQPPAGARTDVC